MDDLDGETCLEMGGSPEGIQPGEILLERVMMIGTGAIPRELFANLPQASFQIFLTEPDPGRFPPEMAEIAAWVIDHTGYGEEGDDDSSEW